MHIRGWEYTVRRRMSTTFVLFAKRMVQIRLTGRDKLVGAGRNRFGRNELDDGSTDQFERGYLIAEDGSLAGVPLASWSSKTFEASWNAPVSKTAAAPGERGADHQPLGAMRNDTGVALRDCVVLYDGWSYELGSLAPLQRAIWAAYSDCRPSIPI